MKRLLLFLGGILGVFWGLQYSLAAPSNSRFQKKPPELIQPNQDSGDSPIALQTQTNEIPKDGSSSGTDDSLSIAKSKKSPRTSNENAEKTETPPSSPSLNPEPNDHSIFRLHQISFESLPNQIVIKIQASGGLLKLRQEKMLNPGRLVLEIPEIMNPTNLNITQLSDHFIVPRIRLAQHPDRLRIIVDTVLMNFPNSNLQKTDSQVILRLEKTPEAMAEAKAKSNLFLAMQRDDREALLKMGSEDEGGILFNDQMGSRIASKGSPMSPPSGGVKVEQGSGPSNRIVFMLDDRKEYKIFIEDTETPIYIRKIRPVFEVKGVQARLKQLGYDVGTEDGSMGPMTHDALMQYQKDKGIPVTGTPNRKTQHALKDEFGY